jgi:hypothetical protein
LASGKSPIPILSKETGGKMRILVTGGREFTNQSLVYEKLKERGASVVIHGGAVGADTCANNYAKEFGLPCLKVEANWDYYGKKAGPIRNQWLLDHCNPEIVLAFPDPNSRGTWHMVKIAREAGIEPNIYE